MCLNIIWKELSNFSREVFKKIVIYLKMYGSFSGKILYNELQKEMTANEKTLIEEFKNQFQYINKKKSQ